MTKIINIKKLDIPEWIKYGKSGLYNLFENNKEIYHIPIDKIENKITILSIADLYKYIEICKFWRLKYCPFEIYHYILNKKKSINIDLDMYYVDEFEILINSKDIAKDACINGHINLLKFTLENDMIIDIKLCNYAAENGHLDCLILAHNNGALCYKETVLLAEQNNHLDCAKYAIENLCSN